MYVKRNVVMLPTNEKATKQSILLHKNGKLNQFKTDSDDLDRVSPGIKNIAKEKLKWIEENL